MSYIDSQPHLGRIILYRDKFPLSGHSSFADFINALNEENFSPYILLINKMRSTNAYHLEVECIPNPLDNPILAQWMFLDEGTLMYLDGSRELVLEASVNILWILHQMLVWGGLIAFLVYLFMITGYMIFLPFAGVCVIPPIMICQRDIHRYKRIRSFAGNQE